MASVDGDSGAADPARLRRRQERDDGADFLGTAKPSERKLAPDVVGVFGDAPAQRRIPKPGQARQIGRAEAIISSMTVEERRNPAIIHGSRRLRIARGSGTTTADVNALLKEFEQARKMMKTLMGGKRMPRIPGMPNLPGIG